MDGNPTARRVRAHNAHIHTRARKATAIAQMIGYIFVPNQDHANPHRIPDARGAYNSAQNAGYTPTEYPMHTPFRNPMQIKTKLTIKLKLLALSNTVKEIL